MDGDDTWRQEWLCSGWKPRAGEEQLGIVDWMGEPWEQKRAEEGFVEGAEQLFWLFWLLWQMNVLPLCSLSTVGRSVRWMGCCMPIALRHRATALRPPFIPLRLPPRSGSIS